MSVLCAGPPTHAGGPGRRSQCGAWAQSGRRHAITAPLPCAAKREHSLGSAAAAILSRYAPRSTHARQHSSPQLRAACLAAATSSQTVHSPSKPPTQQPSNYRPRTLLEVQDAARAVRAGLNAGTSVRPGECNKTLKALCESGGRWSETLHFYRDFRGAGVAVDMTTYRALMLAAIEARQSMDVVELLRAAEAAHGPPPLRTYCELVSRLLRAGRRARGAPHKAAAAAVWRAARAAGHTLDAAAYRTGMNLAVELGQPGEARRLLEAMRGAGLTPGWGGYTILMKAAVRAGDMDAARRLFAELRAYSGDKPVAISAYNTLLSGFVALGDITMARAVLDKARREGSAPDAVSYSRLASGLAGAGRLDEGEALLREAAAAGLPPCEVLYGALLDGCMRHNDWSRATRLLASMRAAGLRPRAAHYNMLLRGACYSSAAATVHLPQAGARSHGALAAQRTHRAPLHSLNGHHPHVGLQPQLRMGAEDALTQQGQPWSAAEPLGACNGSRNSNGNGHCSSSNGDGRVSGGGGGEQPAASATTTVLPSSAAAAAPGPTAALSHTPHPSPPLDVEAVLAEMRATGHRPDAVTYGTLMHAAVRAGSVDGAMAVLSAMRLEGVPPDAATFTSLMKLFRQQGMQAQALEFFAQLSASRSAAVDGWALSCLVAVHAAAGDMGAAEEAAARAGRAAGEAGRAPPREATYALMQGYAQQRQLQPALWAFRRFLAVGGRPHRKMCEFAYRSCLAHFDFKSAGQVLRAMRLMRGLQLRESLYRQLWHAAERRLQARRQSSDSAASAAAGGSGSSGGAGSNGNSNSASCDEEVNMDAEKLKWWFGLPNRYYQTDWREAE